MKQHRLPTPFLAATLIAFLGILGCRPPAEVQMTPESGDHAIARLDATEGNSVTGTVIFTREAGGVRVVADVSGLTPGEHGFHIHEYGDCSAPDASSAGGHFNPTSQPHGGRDAEARHLGDLGNLVADGTGSAKLDYIDTKISLSGTHSIIGRAVIVHAGRDDLVTQPSGASGARVACGVIQIAEAAS